MIDAYRTGDPYLAFAKQAGAVPLDATKTTHARIRDLFKTCALGVQYGMGAESLARRLGKPLVEADELLGAHRRVYSRFWAWSDAAVRHALTLNRLHSVFGWQVRVGLGSNINPRSLMNFPMQANGAEILRLACCLAIERGIRVCAPVHDAILIEAPLELLEPAVTQTQRAMSEASATVLDGFELRTEAKLFRWPDHYFDKRGATMWRIVSELIEECNIKSGISPTQRATTPPLSCSTANI